MSFTPSSAARNACYEAWEATLRAMPAAERAAECARLADEAADSAVKALEPFGAEAGIFRALARFVVERQH